MTVSRRGFLRAGVLGGLGLASGAALAACASPESQQTAVLLQSRRPVPDRFRVPLPIPPVKRPESTSAGADEYVIEQRVGAIEIFPGVRTPIMGYDGVFPGPTIVSRSGRPVVVRHVNRLDVPTVVHLHGGHTPSASDGYPIDLVVPDGWHGSHDHGGMSAMSGDVRRVMRDYRYPMRQRAATLWYHDHRMDHTAPQVYRGLAGFHLVSDREEDELPLPRGERDLPLMLADRAFDADGQLLYPLAADGVHVADNWMSGLMGDVILVNGAPWPVHEVSGARHRLRLLNASNARRYGLELRDDSGRRLDLVQIGSDGGLLPRPRTHHHLDIAPAERFDVVVDFARVRPGGTVTMTNTLGDGATRDVMRFRVKGRVGDDARVPPVLSAAYERLRPGTDAPVREWRFSRGEVDGRSGWVVNGTPFDPERVDAEPGLGRTEVWRFTTDVHHPVHVHLDAFQVRGRGTGGPGAYDHGWKDTIDLRPAERAEVLVRFTDYPGRFLLHCHNLEHEDMAMMAAFRTR